MTNKRYTIISCFAFLFIMLLSASIYAPLTSSGGYNSNIIAKKDIRVSMVNQEPDPVEPGKYVTVKFKLENYGSEDTYPLVIGIKPSFPFTLVGQQEYEKSVSGLDSRQTGDDSKIIEWKLLVNKDAAEGKNELIIYYKELAGEKVNVVYDDEFYVDVRTSDNILKVMNIETEPEKVVPGQKADLKFKLKNIANSFIKDVSIKLDLDDSDITTIGSTSEKIIRKIDGSEIVEVEYGIIPASSSPLGIQKIPLMISFKDNLNNVYTQNSTFGLPLDSEIEYLLSIDSSTIKTSGTKGEVSLKISNPGIGDIKFLSLELQPSPDYEIIESSERYIGNVDSDDYETASFDIYVKPGKTGDIPLRVLMKFRDDYNKQYTIEEEAIFHIYSEEEAQRYGIINKSGFPVWIIIVILVIAGGTFFYYRKRKQKKNKEKSN